MEFGDEGYYFVLLHTGARERKKQKERKKRLGEERGLRPGSSQLFRFALPVQAWLRPGKCMTSVLMVAGTSRSPHTKTGSPAELRQDADAESC